MRCGRIGALLVVLALAGCGSGAVASPSQVLRPESSPPPLNAAERRIVVALARIGLVAQVAEISPPDRASMWVEVGQGRVLSLVTLPAGSPPSDWEVVGGRVLAGVDLREVRDADGFMSEWLQCGPELVRVWGAPPEADGTLDALLERLVPALDCE
ncbi:MAG TPA: hypothetical protein VES19_15425 [Candidatus Limnocylindrales bacterium]|nr:hypothetical protein [Candidatus Limnocylindrales bacterium]